MHSVCILWYSANSRLYFVMGYFGKLLIYPQSVWSVFLLVSQNYFQQPSKKKVRATTHTHYAFTGILSTTQSAGLCEEQRWSTTEMMGTWLQLAFTSKIRSDFKFQRSVLGRFVMTWWYRVFDGEGHHKLHVLWHLHSDPRSVTICQT